MATPQQLLRPTSTRPTPSVSFKADPSATQISGQFLQTIGTAEKAAEARRQKAEKEKLDFAKISFKNDMATARVKAESDLAAAKGVNALEKVSSIKQEFTRQMSERLDKIPERYRDSYDIQSEALRASGEYDRFAIGYTAGETRKYVDDAYTTDIANEMNSMVDNAGDVRFLATTGLPRVATAIRTSAERTYGTDRSKVLNASGVTAGEMIDAQVAAGVSESVRKSIQQQLVVNEFDKAAGTLKIFENEIVPDDRVKILKMIDTARKKEESTRSIALGEEAFRLAGGDLVMAENIILSRSGDDGKVFKIAMDHVKGKSAIRETQKKKNEEKIFTEQYDKFIKTGSFDAAAMKTLPPEEANKLIEMINKNKGGPATVTDQAAKVKIFNEVERMSDQEFVALEINKVYAPYLSAKDREILEVQQRYTRKQIASEYTHGQKYNRSIPRDVAFSFMQSLGIFKDDPNAGEFSRMVEEAYGQIVTENPKSTEMELRKKLTRQVRDKLTTTEIESSWFGPDEEVTKFVDIEDIPETLREDRGFEGSAEVRRIQELRQRLGKRPYTEDEMRVFLNRR